MAASPDVQWMVIRKNNCFLKKGRTISLTAEPNNLKNKHSVRYNGLIHRRTVGVEPAADGKGVVLVTKKGRSARNKPAKLYTRVELKKDWRSNLNTIRNVLGTGYRKDLTNAALRRASAIHKSQKRSTIVRKRRAPKPKSS